jgi:phosphoglycolate phosphatase-like HAD superfamily hydrolase
MTTYLFWDIDGTLLTTARAGIYAWEQAVREVMDQDVDFGSYRTAGLTDAEIALEIAPDAEVAGRVLRAYERLVPEHLGRRRGHVMPNVRENLAALAGRDDVVSMLLTGNVAGGAEAKLRHYGLWEFFAETGGAFCVEGADRPSIARRARELAGEPSGEHMVVIGDTPHDVGCGKAIGARTLAVATGPVYGLDDLRACDPSIAIEALPEPRALAQMLGLP